MIKVGIITRTRDNDGTLFIDRVPIEINKFKDNAEIFIGYSENFIKQFTIEKSIKSGKGLVLKLKEINSSEEAIKFKEYAVFVEESNLLNQDKLHSLTQYSGYRAINKSTNEVIGIVEEELELPAHNVLVIKKEDKEYLIPMVKDFIDSVNNRLRVVKINPIDGLLNDTDD